ncbi:DUF6653 family protein [Mycolicibacterium chlorophenolicum]|uniref:Transmembrane protein n=1 Tax=Mycolicibacterium chlorophenolicum TaxID=37916 RepID=A0A0J6VL51_9MYCO|nr:DUF6653 family protein [Mycolicibacterium chlorophenolicum]KMO70277.1 hypothetical protein MCHLDSM_05165 [Mycolicibacterium chlorophenolicum]
MGALDRYARLVGMSDEAWRRHANPWSVWTRFAAIPLIIVAIWSRVWIGWWALVPCAAVLVWLWWNPRAFGPIETPTAWSSKGIYGERLWLQSPDRMPADFAVVQRIWIGGALVAAALLGWGLVALQLWPAVTGAALLIYGQLWRIDRLGRFYDQQMTLNPPTRH